MKAVVDRFEGDFAVLLFGNNEIKVDIPRILLPHKVKEGSWLNISLEMDPEGEQGQREKMSTLLEKLKNKKV